MSIEFVEYQPSGSLVFDPQSKFWRREYTRNIEVRATDANVGPIDIIGALGFGLGATYAFRGEFDTHAFLNSVEVNPDTGKSDDYLIWNMTLRYGPLNPTEWPEDPTQQPPEIRGGFAQFEEVCQQDLDGKPILNTANDAFDPPVMRDRSRPTLSISDNVMPDAFDPLLAEVYADSVNDGAFIGADPGTVKVTSISYEYLFNPFIGWYWHRNFEFEYRKDTWKKVILDAGLYQLDPSDGITKIPILVNGIAVQEPQLLNGKGIPLPNQAQSSYLNAANYLTFEVYKSKDFSALNLKRAEDILTGNGT